MFGKKLYFFNGIFHPICIFKMQFFQSSFRCKILGFSSIILNVSFPQKANCQIFINFEKNVALRSKSKLLATQKVYYHVLKNKNLSIMKNIYFLFGFVFFNSVGFLTFQTAFAHEGNPQNGFYFTENKGQWDKTVHFRADIPDGFLFLEKNSLHYGFYDGTALRKRHANPQNVDSQTARTEESLKAHGIKVRFLGSNENPTFKSQKPQVFRKNFFIGNDPARWGPDAQGFGEVRYENLYENIDLQFYTDQTALKYDFIVSPKANPAQIRLTYEGVQNMRLENGNLLIQTSVNQFLEKKPVSYQIIQGKKVEVETQFVLENGVLSFVFPKGYDSNYELLIDPELVFATFSGSRVDNWGNTATHDENGNLVAAGTVFGVSFPTTIGAFDQTFNGVVDIAIIKFNSAGNQALYITYLGGNAAEVPHSIVVNKAKQLVVLGSTSSRDYPVSFNAFDRSFNGGSVPNLNNIIGDNPYLNGSDILVTILAENGNSVAGSTYLGGSANDGLNHNALVSSYGDQFRGDVFTDDDNHIYIASATLSSDFPVTSSAAIPLYRGNGDAVIVKMNPTASGILYSTFWGGSGADAAYSIKVSKIGEIIVAGGTQSVNFPLIAGANRTIYGGNTDGFVSKFNSNGIQIASTYVGTTGYDQAYFVDLNTEGEIYVYGSTTGNYPIIGANIYSNGNSGQFIHKFDKNLSTTVFSTRIGSGRGTPDIAPTAFLVSNCGHIYIAGWGGLVNNIGGYRGGSSTVGMPVTTDAFKRATDGSDFYLAILDKNAQKLLYGTFFGGNTPNDPSAQGDADHVDGGTSRFDKRGQIYHSVCACRNGGFPATTGSFSTTNNATGGCNNAAFKFELQSLKAAFVPLNEKNEITRKGCAPLKLKFDNRSRNGVVYEWDFGNFGKSGQNTNIEITFVKTGKYPVRLRAENEITCLPPDFAYDTIEVIGGEFAAKGDTTLCYGEQTQLSVTGTVSGTYLWTPAAGLNNPNSQNPTAKPEKTTTYQVRILTGDACTYNRNVTVNVREKLEARFEVKYELLCEPFPLVRITNLSSTADFYQWDLGNGQTFTGRNPPPFKYEAEGNYTIKLRLAQQNCPAQKDTVVSIFRNDYLAFYKNIRLSNPSTICLKDSVQLRAEGGVRYVWSPSAGLSNPNIANPKASPAQTTLYKVTIFNERGCGVDTTIRVEIKGKVIADFEAVTSTECGKKATLKLSNKTQEATTVVWRMGNGTVLSSMPSNFTYEQSGTYDITLEATNGICSDKKTIKVVIDNIIPPNVITPNGDGKNDTFAVGNASSGWKIQISDRWGKVVFQSDNYKNDWGGEASNTTYFYTLTSPEGKKCQGWIQVFKGN